MTPDLIVVVLFFAMETGFSNSLPPPMREAHFDLR